MAAVKTAISLERGLLREIDRLSRKLRIPRSRLFARAAEEFLRRHRAAELTEQMNRAWAQGEPAEDRAFRRAAVAQFGRRTEGTW